MGPMMQNYRMHALILCLLLGTVTALADGTSGSGAISITNSSPIVESFDALSNSTTPSNSLPPGWYLTELGSGPAADGSYVVSTGSSNAGGAYSFGAATVAERALGSVGSGTVSPIYYGAKFTNNATGPITALTIEFNGEMWRRGNAATVGDVLTFAYSVSATSLSSAGYTNFPPLSFSSLENACASGAAATNGNATPCRSHITATITGLSINPGGSIFIRWGDSDTQNSDDGLAIDDVSVTATISSASTPPSATASITPDPAAPGQAIALSGTIITGFNPLSQSFSVTCDLTQIGGAANQSIPVSGAALSFATSVGASAGLGSRSLPCSISDDLARSTTFNVALTVLLPLSSTCGAAATPISAIQGSGLSSPLAGLTLDVEAVVTSDLQASGLLSGFYLQDPVGDGNPATSEGIFVFSSIPVNTGDRVRVRGNAVEFASSGSSLTELSSVTSAQVCSSGNALPAAVEVSLPVPSVSFWERYEGMLVRFSQQLVVTGNFNLGQFGQIDLAPSLLYQPTQTPGNSASWAVAADLVRRSILALDDNSSSSGVNLNGGGLAPYPQPGLSNANTLRAGALVNPNGDTPLPLIGILDDRFGAYRIQPTAAVTFSNSPNPRPATTAIAASAGGRIRIVSTNVLNFFTTLGSRGAFTATELANQRAKIIAAMSAANGDIFGLSELQNFANGQTNGGAYTNSAIEDLTVALAAATGKTYRFIDTITPANLAPGNAVTDNGTDAIRSGLIYNADTVTPVGPAALYYQNDQNRPSLAQTFRPVRGPGAANETFTVVVNHFRSKGSACGGGSDDPFQGSCNGMRLSMANHVRAWLAANPTADPAGVDRAYILIGDFNAYFGEDPIQALLSSGYTNLIHLLIGPKAYSFNFGSQAGYLDHAIVNAAALRLVKNVAELHINADEPAALQALDTNIKSPAAQAAYYAGNEFAASDHDPLVVGFNPLWGDFNDDGILDDDDRVALLAARGQSGARMTDRRMDMDADGTITQQDFHIWQDFFKQWKKAVH
jgi:predicted extracellular nuclease